MKYQCKVNIIISIFLEYIINYKYLKNYFIFYNLYSLFVNIVCIQPTDEKKYLSDTSLEDT